MYIPKIFKKENSKQVIEFIKENSFATLISTENEKSLASHIPIDIINFENEYYLTGHLSKANTQITSLEKNKNVLITFLGYNHYISSKWYSHENVPTWNYIAVQVRGEIELITNKDKLIEFLSYQIDKYEEKVKSNLKLSHLSDDFLSKEIQGIIGFKISIQNIDIAYKLSQNRSKLDYLNIISELQKVNSVSSNLLASEMQLEYMQNKISESYNNITFDVCKPNECLQIYNLRNKCFSKNKSYLLELNSINEEKGQDNYDKFSTIYNVKYKNECVGSCRITPIYELQIEELQLHNSENNVLLSRVCIDSGHRNKNLHLFMFYKFSNYILNNTNYTDYFAFCTEDEFRLYEKLGAKKTSENQIKLYKNQINDYFIVKGNIKEFNKLIIQILN
jgi:transcriptional regulator